MVLLYNPDLRKVLLVWVQWFNFKLIQQKSGLDIFYSDTDSLVLNRELPPKYCDPAKLGMLKLEDGSTITKCKGYSGKLHKAQYLALLEGQPLDLTVIRWTRNLGEGSVQIKQGLPYRLSPVFLKRQKVIDSQGVWWILVPLFLAKLANKLTMRSHCIGEKCCYRNCAHRSMEREER
jgi:hypothetical protein